MKAEIKVHFKKKETQINIKVPLTKEEREIIEKCIASLIEKLKVDSVKILTTTPYKNISKIREHLKEINLIVEEKYHEKSTKHQPIPNQSKKEIKANKEEKTKEKSSSAFDELVKLYQEVMKEK